MQTINSKEKESVEALLDRLSESLESNLQYEFLRYIVKVSQVKESFYVLIKKPRGKILRDNMKQAFKDVKYLSENLYKRFSNQSTTFH